MKYDMEDFEDAEFDVTEIDLRSVIKAIERAGSYAIGGRVSKRNVLKKTDIDEEIVGHLFAYFVLNGSLGVKFLYEDPDTGEIGPEHDSLISVREAVGEDDIVPHLRLSFYLPE